MDNRTLFVSPTNGFSIKPLKVKLLAGEQKAKQFSVASAHFGIPKCQQNTNFNGFQALGRSPGMGKGLSLCTTWKRRRQHPLNRYERELSGLLVVDVQLEGLALYGLSTHKRRAILEGCWKHFRVKLSAIFDARFVAFLGLGPCSASLICPLLLVVVHFLDAGGKEVEQSSQKVAGVVQV